MGKWMIDRRYLHSELTGGVIGCAMEVHSALGSGFQEVVYQRSLAAEMLDRGISFSREHEMPIFYKGLQVGTRRVDFLVADVVSVEKSTHPTSFRRTPESREKQNTPLQCIAPRQSTTWRRTIWTSVF